MASKPPILGAGLCFVVLMILQLAGVQDTSVLKIVPGVLFWVFAGWALLALLRRGWRRGLRERADRAPLPEPSRAPAPTAPTTTRARCAWHHNKAIFDSEAEAQKFVQWTQDRHAAGRWNGKPMDHCYRCPVLLHRHWHVSSKPSRPW